MRGMEESALHHLKKVSKDAGRARFDSKMIRVISDLQHSACQWLRWGAKHSPSTLERILIQCVVLNLSGPSIDLCSKFSHSGYVLVLRSWSRPFHAYLPITGWRLW